MASTTLTKAYMLFLARWARRLSWKETAEAFHTSWDKVFDAVEHVVTWGLEHRMLEPDRRHRSGRNPVRQRPQVPDAGLPDRPGAYPPALGRQGTHHRILPRILHRDRRRSSPRRSRFVCSDMWQPYLKVIREKGTRRSTSSTASTSWPRCVGQDAICAAIVNRREARLPIGPRVAFRPTCPTLLKVFHEIFAGCRSIPMRRQKPIVCRTKISYRRKRLSHIPCRDRC